MLKVTVGAGLCSLHCTDKQAHWLNACCILRHLLELYDIKVGID